MLPLEDTVSGSVVSAIPPGEVLVLSQNARGRKSLTDSESALKRWHTFDTQIKCSRTCSSV